jgi:P27 family predicted phage terminase small subunit
MSQHKSRTVAPHRRIKSALKKQRTDSNMDLLIKNAAEPKPSDEKKKTKSFPKPPAGMLTAVGLAKWREVCEKLQAEYGDVNDLDSNTILFYCDAWQDYVRAVSELKKTKHDIIKRGERNGGQFRNPWHDVKKKAVEEMMRLSAMLGLSEYDRAKIKGASRAASPSTAPNEFDKL